MGNTNLILFTVFLSSLSGLEFSTNDEIIGKPYCYHFSWLGPTHDEEKHINCSSKDYEKIPCIRPFKINPTHPNLTEIWIDSKKNSEFVCSLRPGYSCIKYTYSFNNAVVNNTYFCGKMIENSIAAISNGCYSQKIGGHIVEACACKSTGFGMPCNFSTKNSFSVFIAVLLILLTILVSF